MKTVFVCALALLMSSTTIADIKLIEEKVINKGLRCSLIEVGGHEYVVFSHSECMHSQHHAGCKYCATKRHIITYQSDPSVQTEVRKTVICYVTFDSSDNTDGCGISTFSVRNYTLDELQKASDYWESLLEKDRPSRITFHITNSIGCMASVEEKIVSFIDFMKKVRPQTRKVTNEEWRNTVLKNLDKFPSIVPI